MEEKKTAKISLSTFFLIIAIVVIGIMGYFLYVSNSKATAMLSNEKELNTKITNLENEIADKEVVIKSAQNTVSNDLNSEEVNPTKDTISNNSNTSNTMTFSSLKGKYVGNADVKPGTTPDGETEVSLYLYENGSYKYNNMPGLASGHIGYYTFSDNNLILHKIADCGNDIGRTLTSGTITLKINNDNSITDNELSAILKKSSDKIEKDHDIINTELKNALNNNSLR